VNRIDNNVKKMVAKMKTRDAATLFAAAAVVLRPYHLRWCHRESQPEQTELFDAFVASVGSYIDTGTLESAADLQRRFEETGPFSLGGDIVFGAAQDCWICAHTAVAVAQGIYDPAQGTWYLLEPLQSAICVRLFGFMAPGGEDIALEEDVVRDPVYVTAVDAIHTAITGLSSKDHTTLDQVAHILEPIADLDT